MKLATCCVAVDALTQSRRLAHAFTRDCPRQYQYQAKYNELIEFISAMKAECTQQSDRVTTMEQTQRILENCRAEHLSGKLTC